uniref:Uncharacterized protein n=1 Tax=Anguilla anguilla TaxID=7936 RepID=A0A0E9PTH1_ANGAN
MCMYWNKGKSQYHLLKFTAIPERTSAHNSFILNET